MSRSRNPESRSKRSAAAKKGWRTRRRDEGRPRKKNPESRSERSQAAKRGWKTRRSDGLAHVRHKNPETRSQRSAAAKRGWAGHRSDYMGDESRAQRSAAAKKGWQGRGYKRHKRNPGVRGIFTGIIEAAKTAGWQILGAKLIFIPANAIKNAMSASQDLGYFIKGGLAVVPLLFEGFLGNKAELFTAGALTLLGNDILDNVMTTMNLPASVTSLLQSEKRTQVVYVPTNNAGMKRWLPPGQTGPVGRLMPTGTAADFKPATH